MKKILIVAFAVALALTCVSCAKEGLDLFKGRYTYVTSGTVTFQYNPFKLELAVINDRGVVNVEKGVKGQTVVTFSSIAADQNVFDATVDGDKITLEARVCPVTFRVGLVPVTKNLVVSGSGYRTGKLMVIEMHYSDPNVTGSNVNCVATIQE